MAGPGIGIKILSQQQNPDGTSTVTLQDGRKLNTSSEEYIKLYNSGFLYGEDPQGNIYLGDNAHPEMKRYKDMVDSSSYKEYMRPYFEGQSGAIANGMGQSFDRYWEVNNSYKDRYDSMMNKKWIDDFLERNPQGENQDRVAYLTDMAENNPSNISDYVNANLPANLRPSIWSNFSQGMDYLLENPFTSAGGNDSMEERISNNPNLTAYEKQQQIKSLQDNPNLSRLGGVAQTLGPLSIPAKAVQSIYRNDYSLGDALSGTQNDAGIVEDVLTDPLTYIGIGAANGTKLPKVPNIVDEINNFGNKNLPNAYKYNPLAFKPSKDAFYRQVDGDTFNELDNTLGFIKGKQDVGPEGGKGLINLNRSFGDDAYYNKGDFYFPDQRPDYMFEAKLGEDAFIPKVNGRTKRYTTENTNVRVSKEPLDVYDPNVRMYEKDWLQGYKKIDPKKTYSKTTDNGFEMERNRSYPNVIRGSYPDDTKVAEFMDLTKHVNEDTPFYEFLSMVGSSPLKAGKAYNAFDEFIPKGAILKMPKDGSLSYDSFTNIMKQAKSGKKFDAYQDGYVQTNYSSKDPTKSMQRFRTEQEAIDYFKDLRSELDNLNVGQIKTIKTNKLPSHPWENLFPNIVLKKKEDGGPILPEWIFK